MILALEALEIAAHRGDGERGRPRKEMKDWFLFNGVYIQGDRAAVNEGVKFPSLILSNSTQSSFRRGDEASMVTKNTSHLSIL
jgi:hypothetical protein